MSGGTLGSWLPQRDTDANTEPPGVEPCNPSVVSTLSLTVRPYEHSL